MTIQIFAAVTALLLPCQEGNAATPQKPLQANAAPETPRPPRLPTAPLPPNPTASGQLPSAPPVPQDFAEALRQHLRAQGDSVSPQEAEEILGALEEIRSAVGGPVLWPDDLAPTPGALNPIAPDRRPQPGHSLPQVQSSGPMWTPVMPHGAGPEPWLTPHPQPPKILPEPWKPTEVTFEHALRQAARLLDQAAAELEDQSRYDQADHLRERANQLRMEARESKSTEPQTETDPPPHTSFVPKPFQPGDFKQQAMVIQVLR